MKVESNALPQISWTESELSELEKRIDKEYFLVSKSLSMQSFNIQDDPEFLCKGYFIVDGQRGNTLHKVLRLDKEYFKEFGKNRLDTPVNFVVESWVCISDK